jgi:molybdopterin/thiamine biosynthesis adenylyltransferase
MQAGEAIRLIAEGTSPLAGQLMLFDARGMEWQSVAIPRNPHCPACS